jgi:uncharacterized protein YcbK (DUF882 family)
MRGIVIAIALSLAAATATTAASADVTHVVQPGHTLESIAHRYHVTVKAIVHANGLDRNGQGPPRLKPGDTLVIPGVDAPAHGGTAKTDSRTSSRRAGARAEEKPGRYEKGVVHVLRPAGTSGIEDIHIRLRDTGGHIPPTAFKAFEHVMRQGNSTHPPDARLIALVAIVSDHFSGRPLQVVSGYRAYTPTQYTPHSNHNYGKALDFRIAGITNEELRDFCLTLRNAGCGYYPNSTFVHLDVRDTKAYWIDRSRPGEPPLYDRPGVTADEGTSDVPNESAPDAAPGPGQGPGSAGSPAPSPSTLGTPSTEQSL